MATNTHPMRAWVLHYLLMAFTALAALLLVPSVAQ